MVTALRLWVGLQAGLIYLLASAAEAVRDWWPPRRVPAPPPAIAAGEETCIVVARLTGPPGVVRIPGQHWPPVGPSASERLFATTEIMARDEDAP